MLAQKFWWREARPLAWWGLALVSTVMPSLLAIKSMLTGEALEQITRLISQLPPALRSFMGTTTGEIAVNTWVISLIYRTMAPLILTVYTGIAVLSVVTKDADAGSLVYVLSQPVSRQRVLVGRYAAVAANLLLLHVALLVAVGLGVMAIGEPVKWTEYAILTLNSYLAQAALLSVLLAITTFVDDYNRGLFIGVGLGLLLYFLPVSIEPGTRIAALRYLSPFAYLRPNEVMRSRSIPGEDLLVLVATCVLALALSVYLFKRKQVYTR